MARKPSAKLLDDPFRLPNRQRTVPAFDASAKENRAAEELEKAKAKIDRRTVIDEETETILFQLIEKSTGEVKQQFPDDVLLNVREYAREDIAARQPGADDEPTTSRSA